ncbi:MAG: MBL fold metallo-hydrolase [Bacteroidota bacterium]
MDRRQFLKTSSLAAAGLLFPWKSLLAQDNPLTMIRRNVGYFSGRGGTIGFLMNKDAMAAVDSQYPEAAQKFITALRDKAGDSSRRFDLLINTHHHGDHTGGNPAFRPVTDHIIAHKNVPGLQKQFYGDSDNEQVYADTTYSDSWSQQVGDETVHLSYHGPAHTGGDSVVYFEKANVVHTGDLMFNRWYPVIDRPAGALIENWIQILERISDTYPSDTVYIFGHGNPKAGVTGTEADLLYLRDYLSHLLAYTQGKINEGWSLQELQDNTDSFEQFADFEGPGGRLTLDFNLKVAYQELTHVPRSES